MFNETIEEASSNRFTSDKAFNTQIFHELQFCIFYLSKKLWIFASLATTCIWFLISLSFWAAKVASAFIIIFLIFYEKRLKSRKLLRNVCNLFFPGFEHWIFQKWHYWKTEKFYPISQLLPHHSHFHNAFFQFCSHILEDFSTKVLQLSYSKLSMVPKGNRNAGYMHLIADKLELLSSQSGLSVQHHFSDILRKKAKISETPPEGLKLVFTRFWTLEISKMTLLKK